jgi:hypothetical protein
VDEARPPRRVAGISGCIGAMAGAFCRRLVGAWGSTARRVRLEDDGLVVEEFKLPLWLAAGRGFCRDITLVTTARFTAASFGFSPMLRWSRVLLGEFVCVRCFAVVSLASACDVQLLPS